MPMSCHVPRASRSNLLRIALCLGVAALSACRGQVDPAPAAPETAAATAAQPAQAAKSAEPGPGERQTPAFLSSFTSGMPYAQLREAVLSAGWLPLRDPACWDKPDDEVALCGALPEVADCDDRKRCTLWFAVGNGRRLRIAVEADANAGGGADGTPQFLAREWELIDSPAAAVAASCPAADFEGFLRRFAADAAIRRAHTAPLLELAELYLDDAGNDAARTVLIAAADYRDFDLVHRDGAYHYVDAAGNVDSAALPIEIETPSADVRLVRFAYGMSEGNSYRFENRNGCWALTGDPEPPSP